MKSMLQTAKRGKYGVGAFNFNDFDDAAGIAEAAKATGSPVILMTSEKAAAFIGPAVAAGIARGLAESMGAPCALHLDHAKNFDFICECVRAGYTSVMIDASEMPFHENIKTTKKVADFAKGYDVSVEGELGTIGGKEDGIHGKAELIDPSMAAEYVEKTGVDALAAGIGTVHGFYKSEPAIRFDLISEVARLTDAPLVMHGGTGVSEADFKRAIECGIVKVNVGTELKHVFTRALRECAAALPEEDIEVKRYMSRVREACKRVAEGKMAIFGCAGKAAQ